MHFLERWPHIDLLGRCSALHAPVHERGSLVRFASAPQRRLKVHAPRSLFWLVGTGWSVTTILHVKFVDVFKLTYSTVRWPDSVVARKVRACDTSPPPGD